MPSMPMIRRLLMLLCYVYVLCLVSYSSSVFSGTSQPSSSSKVSLDVYYESLCPDCTSFIVNHLIKLFDDDLISIVDLHLSPWGNSKLRPDNVTVVCQHGALECFLDTVEACAIDVWPELSDHFSFIYCVESLVIEYKYGEWESCYEKPNLNSKPLADCLSSGHGKELQLQYAAETSALEPPHKYVPWVVVDGQPLYEAVQKQRIVRREVIFPRGLYEKWMRLPAYKSIDQGEQEQKFDDHENFISYICKAYKGDKVPAACAKYSSIPSVDLNRFPLVNLKGVNTMWELLERIKASLFSNIDVTGLL